MRKAWISIVLFLLPGLVFAVGTVDQITDTSENGSSGLSQFWQEAHYEISCATIWMATYGKGKTYTTPMDVSRFSKAVIQLASYDYGTISGTISHGSLEVLVSNAVDPATWEYFRIKVRPITHGVSELPTAATVGVTRSATQDAEYTPASFISDYGLITSWGGYALDDMNYKWFMMAYSNNYPMCVTAQADIMFRQ